MYDENVKKFLCILCMALLAVVFSTSQVFASEASDNSKSETGLYATRLISVTVPRTIQEQCAKKLGATLSSTYIYLAIAVNGQTVWYSPKLLVKDRQTTFEWPDKPGSLASFWWDKSTPVTLRAFLSDNSTQAIASGAAVGAAGGAGTGGLIGRVLAGVFTGGLAAPAGALIGAAIGGTAGGTIGGVTGAISANDRVLYEVTWTSESDKFPLDGKIIYRTSSLGETCDVSTQFQLQKACGAVSQGDLQPGQKYIVCLKSAYLSNEAARHGGKKIEDNRYYFVIRQGDREFKYFEDDPLSIPVGINKNLGPVITVMKNTGEETEILIKAKKKLRDKTVFISHINTRDGRSWVFIDKATADDGSDCSFVEFETYGPLK